MSKEYGAPGRFEALIVARIKRELLEYLEELKNDPEVSNSDQYETLAIIEAYVKGL